MIGNVIAVDMHPGCAAEKERLTEECQELFDEVKALEATVESLVGLNKMLVKTLGGLCTELATERARYTLGGAPPGYHQPGAWSNESIAPPPSASDESAPPLHRRLT
ncbi:MAG: hypothetical protein JWO67_4514 [Streptosporangiaceae bacterium]|nr:hypothetical protein [Streptosporangiaceae bacterium]